MSPADITLALEDVGWMTQAKSNTGQLSVERRTQIIKECRMYWHRDPHCKQAVRLWTDYAVGTGIIYKSEDAAIQKKLDKFWKYHKNRCLTSSQGQDELSTQELIDGDIFFAIFTDGDVPVIRTIDCLQITAEISDPEDDRTIIAFRREFTGLKGQITKLYYKNWCAEDSDVSKAVDPDSGKSFAVEDNVVIYQHSFDKFGKRGNGLLSTVVDWSRYHRQFMNARVALTQALAKFAYKLTAKGSQKVVDAIATQLGSTLATTGTTSGLDKNPPTTPGGTWVQNQGLDIMPMPRATGGGDAKSDGDQLKLMVSAGTNIMLHYFGDPSTGNLATAEAMELPMLKSFTRYQESWKDCWRDLFSIVLEEGLDDEPAEIKIHLPPMLKDDLSRLGQFLMGLHQVFPEIQVPEILEMCLVALGAPNVEETMAAIAAKAKELNAGAPGTDDPSTPGVGPQPGTKSPLGQQLPQPSIKISKFTPQPKGSKEAWIEVTRTTGIQQTSTTVPIIIENGHAQESDRESLKEIVHGFSESLKQLFESRQHTFDDADSSERTAKLNRLLSKEDESVQILKRLAEALEKDPSPLLSEGAIERLIATPPSVKKTGTIFRDGNGQMKFTMEESAQEQ